MKQRINGQKWTNEENELLKKIYSDYPTKFIKKTFKKYKRTWDSVKLHAEKLGLKRNVVDSRGSKVESLLLDTPEAFYWVGFIMADGSINHEFFRLKIGLAKKDEKHLKKLAKFIKNKKIKYVKGGYRKFLGKEYLCSTIVRIDAQNNIIIKELIKKFDFKKNKTENPPKSIMWMKNDLFLAFLCGFIDGDGNIKKLHKRNDATIRIKIHKTWLYILEQIRIKLINIFNINICKPKLNKDGYALLSLTNIKLLRELKLKVINLNIPLMKRKWSIIDEKLISRYEVAENRRNKIKILLKNGKTKTEISNILNVTYSFIYTQIKKYNLK